jgi:hypothetical protein
MNRFAIHLVLIWLGLFVLGGLVLALAQPLQPFPASEGAVALAWLGNPIVDEAYSARHIRDLQTWQGRVYLGYGDWAANLGPVDIWYYTPTAGLFLSETVYVSPTRPAAPVDEESIDRLVVIDHDLYIPGTDPRDPWDLGNFYRNDGSGWRKYRTIPDGIHAFDMAGYEGELFAAIGANDNAPLVRSDDGGLTWAPAISQTGYDRFYELYELADTLFAVRGPTSVYSKPVLFRYEPPWFVTTTVELVPDRPDNLILLHQGIFPFEDAILYVPSFRDEGIDCIRPVAALYQAHPEQDGQPVPFFDGKFPRDVAVTAKRVYVLDAGGPRCFWDEELPDPAGYTATIYASTDLVHWASVATAHFPDTPNALEILDGNAYVGTYNGDIYALPVDLPHHWFYLPLIFRFFE